ncbi:MAG: hypothetical protein JWO38_2039 [Gemmataceae bacterium]|nr:hypothetical protein [Gemmataceae bacterium]
MTAARVALPKVNTWSGLSQIQTFLSSLVPHWEGVDDVILDFTPCTFLSAEGAALLAAFKLNRDLLWGTTDIDWATVSADVARQLGRWEVSPLFGRAKHPWADTAIPLLHQTNIDHQRLVGYICSQVCAAGNMPAMSEALTTEVQRALIELFQNIFLHASSPTGGIAVGQLYPQVKEVQICVCDAGVGMIRKIREAGLAQASSPATLEWALGVGNTTRRPENGPPGGLGLYLLREFVKINGGSLRVVANDGYLCQQAGEVVRQTLPVDFPGTLIQIKLNIRDDVVYKFASE